MMYCTQFPLLVSDFPHTQCDIGLILVSAFQCVSSRSQRIFKVVILNMYFHDPTCSGHMICFV